MFKIELTEYAESHPVQLSAEDLSHLISDHSSHIELNPLRDGRYVIRSKSFIGYIVLKDTVIFIKPKVPNDNLIYILSYLFNIPRGEDVLLSKDSVNSVPDIIAMLLINRVKELIKKGMFRGYIKKKEFLPGLKGKLPVSSNLFYIDRLFCVFDDLSYSVYENIVLKGTLRLLLSLEVSDIVKNEARALIKHLSEIDDVPLDIKLFSRINYSRLNNHYKPLIVYCQLIYNSMSIKNSSGNIRFSSFLLNMNTLFENFLRVYLQTELPEYRISKRSISDWSSGAKASLIPVLEPDIVIKDHLVIDAKYYRDVLTSRGKLKSENLYQIITYMNSMNLPGLLIYPLNNIIIKEHFRIKDGLQFSIYTLDLSGSIDSFKIVLADLKRFILEIISSNMENNHDCLVLPPPYMSR